MYKSGVKWLVSLIILSMIFLPVVYGAAADQTQELADIVYKVMQSVQKNIVEDINKNVDANFQTLDQRIMDNQMFVFRKAIFAILGGMTVVLFAYAFVINRVNRKYDLNFYEKMVDSKIENISRFSGGMVVSNNSFYSPITVSQFDEKYISPERYFNDNFDEDKKVIENQKRMIEELQSRLSVVEKTSSGGGGWFGKKKEEKPPVEFSKSTNPYFDSATTPANPSKTVVKAGGKGSTFIIVAGTALVVILLGVLYIHFFKKVPYSQIGSYLSEMLKSKLISVAKSGGA